MSLGNGTLAAALLSELDDAALDKLADQLAPRICARLKRQEPQPDGWLDATGAAVYLGISRTALHKHTAARSIPFEQDGPGCKLWFRRSELDAWRRGDHIVNTGLAYTSASKTLPNARTEKERI